MTKEETYLRMAALLSLRSTCRRVGSTGRIRRVGALITTGDLSNIVSVGYNGNARGLPDRCDHPEVMGGCGCLHAEANAITKCHHSAQDKVLFVTDAPCPQCAKLIINNGFSRVVYLRPYREETGLELLRTVGIKVEEAALGAHPLLQALPEDIPGW